MRKEYEEATDVYVQKYAHHGRDIRVEIQVSKRKTPRTSVPYQRCSSDQLVKGDGGRGYRRYLLSRF